MTNRRRATILKMASTAYEMDLHVVKGIVSRDDDGHWRIGDRDLKSWLTEFEGEEIVLIFSSLEDKRPVETKTCHTCGRDYFDIDCPYCRESRMRLRGKP